MSALKFFWRPAASVITTALLASIALPSHAFTDDEARRAIIELRQQLKQMNAHNQQTRLLLADQIEEMRQEIANLRGKVETLDWQSAQNQQGSTTERVISDPQEQAAYEAAM